MQLRARHFQSKQPLAITIANHRVQSVTPTEDHGDLPWIAPSFFDIQINGCLGRGFVSPNLTIEDVGIIARACRSHGIGGFLPTLITNSFELIDHGLATVVRACERDPELKRMIPGFHLEGPYLSGEDGPRGAHPRDAIRDPDWDEFARWQETARGRIRMMTVAPERTGAIPFIEKLTSSGVIVAIGHTAATGEEIHAAVQAGAKISTHLGNGCHAMMKRHPNVLWEQLACNGLWASFIPDGHHLPASFVQCLVRMKGSHTVITCDAGNLAGLPPGRYREWGTELDVLPGGKIVVPGTPYLAGSGCFTDTCVSEVRRMTGMVLADAIAMASIRPRELLGLDIPMIEVGERASFVLIDDRSQSVTPVD